MLREPRAIARFRGAFPSCLPVACLRRRCCLRWALFGHDSAGPGAADLVGACYCHGASGAPQGTRAAALLHRDARARRRAVLGQDGHHHVGSHGGRGHLSVADRGRWHGRGESEVSVPVETTVLDFALANVARATSADANETCQALLNYYADRPVEVSEPLAVIPFSSSKSGAAPRLRRVPM